MGDEWTKLSETPFNTEMEAYKFVNKMKMQMQAHYGLYPEPQKNVLEFKVIEEGIKFYIIYKML